ncbi:amino acid ABC transporter permease [Glaciimonas sp. PCH181]|uniref:amino acid ABC transporter permease n=1 Tax=Glaciimonas sp. PCH181 TaxID=2133943 RepID=UPI000D361B18|nr:amino acid ABC transporter permease [Glaciimonas sp. PCH181]PUA18887.1 ABC transporter permease [Glaciimonas sp. PCH181]
MHYEFDFSSVLAQWPLFLHGAWVTAQLTVFSTFFGFILGTLCAIALGSRFAALRGLVAAYVEVIRNTPLLIQSYFLIFGMSSIGMTVPITAGVVLAMVVNIGAYTCEIMRAGIESINKGQIEAAECLGMSRAAVFWHVVLLPATERVYPALSSQFVLLMLASSIMSAVGAEELFGISNRVQSDTYRSFEVFVVVWIVYLVLSFLLRLAFALLARFFFPRRRKLGTPL